MAAITSVLLGTALAATAVGTGLSVYGQRQQAKTAEKIASYNAKVQERNAEIQRTNAKIAVSQASVEAERKRDLKRKLAGTQITNALKSGTDISGSVSDIMYDSAIELEREALIEIYKGNLSAHGYESQAVSYEQQAELERAQGAIRADQFKAGATRSLLSGISSLGMMGGQIYSGGPRIE